jgi:hypothetical protein
VNKRRKEVNVRFRSETFKQIVGKTIAGIVIHDGIKAGPRDQLFIVFTDNTYMEFYGDMGWTSHLEVGDLETVKQYAARLGGNVEVIP